MAAPNAVTRLEVLLALGLLAAFLLPWIEGPTPLTGLDLVSLARGRQAEQAEAILLVAYSAIPVTALLVLAAALLRHGVRFFSGLAGGLSVLGIALLWIARAEANQDAGVGADLGIGAWLTGFFGLLLLLATLGVLQFPGRRS